MKRLIGYAALGLVVCMLLQATATGGPSAPQRPHFYWGSETYVIDMTTGAADYWASGHATHFGEVENVGTFVFDPYLAFTGSGTLTTATGEQVFWEASGSFATGQALIVITGGTGRFEHVSGELNSFKVTNMVQVEQPPYLIMTLDMTATGWIRY